MLCLTVDILHIVTIAVFSVLLFLFITIFKNLNNHSKIPTVLLGGRQVEFPSKTSAGTPAALAEELFIRQRSKKGC